MWAYIELCLIWSYMYTKNCKQLIRKKKLLLKMFSDFWVTLSTLANIRLGNLRHFEKYLNGTINFLGKLRHEGLWWSWLRWIYQFFKTVQKLGFSLPCEGGALLWSGPSASVYLKCMVWDINQSRGFVMILNTMELSIFLKTVKKLGFSYSVKEV